MATSTAPVLAVDIGGTKFAVGLVDDRGELLVDRRVPTPQGVDGEELYSFLGRLIDDVLGGGDVSGVGIGCGGPMAWPAGEVSPLNMPAWRGFALRKRLEERFPDVPVRLHNDAICTVIGEHWRGAGRGHDHLLGMVVSTGVGGGLILGGRTIDGATGNAGHVGHIVVVPGGQECGCGGRGCLEAEVRGPRIAEWAQRHGWRPGERADHLGRPTERVSAVELAVDARAGDSLAIEAFARAGRLLGLGIASAVATLDVDLVVIGGGITQAGSLLFDPLRAAYAEHARIGFARQAAIVPAELGQAAGLIGAAALVLAPERYWSAD
jgi:glucokinase